MPDPQGKRVIRGTQPVAPASAPAEAPRYTVKNPSPEAQQYYQNVVPTMQRLIGQKHDETYTDENGRTCRANSCLSFANTVQEQATSQQRSTRTKAQLYNPEFTRTAERQGWVQVPLEMAQAGDRLQYWQGVDDFADAKDEAVRAQLQQVVQQRVADLGGRELIQNRYPSHMMVLGAPLREYGNQGQQRAQVYNDGHEREAANVEYRADVSPRNYVAYRYIGQQPQATAPGPTKTIRGTVTAQ
jgi:hypothetical protein